MRIAYLSGASDDDGNVAGLAVGDKIIGPVNDKIIAALIEHGRSAHIASIGAGIGLGEAPGPYPLARG